MANKKQSPRKGVPYRFQGNEAIGTEKISSAGALWGRDDLFRRGPLGPRRSLPQGPFGAETMSSAESLVPVATAHSFCTPWKGPPIVRMIGDRNKCYEQILLALFVLIDYLKCLPVRFNFVNVNNPNCINLCPKERPGCFFPQGLSLHLCHWGALATSLKKRIHVLLVFTAIIPNHLLGQL